MKVLARTNCPVIVEGDYAEKGKIILADFLGVSESEVRGSTAASMWKDFQGRGDELKSLLAEIADEEHADRWFSNLKTAFTT